MSQIGTFTTAMMEVEGSTLFMFSLICFAAIMTIRDHVSNVFILTSVFPLAMLISTAAYVGCATFELFSAKKMGEWLVWTIIASTVGNMVVIGVIAWLSNLHDHNRSTPLAVGD